MCWHGACTCVSNAVEVRIFVTWSSRVPTRWGCCSKPLSGVLTCFEESLWWFGLVMLVKEKCCMVKWLFVWCYWCGHKQKRDTYGAWEHYLGLEHTDTAPKRSHAVNQVYLSSHNIPSFFIFKRWPPCSLSLVCTLVWHVHFQWSIQQVLYSPLFSLAHHTERKLVWWVL